MKKRAKGKPKGNGIAGRRSLLEDATFVGTWVRSKSVAEVAKAFGLTYSGAQARAKLLRDAGVKLPKFTRQKRHVDVARLNKLLRGRA
jgi:hypothetical protein